MERGNIFLFKLPSYLSCLGFFFFSMQEETNCFNRKNLNPFNPCKTDYLALEFLQVYLSSLDHLWIIMTAVSNIRNHFN